MTAVIDDQRQALPEILAFTPRTPRSTVFEPYVVPDAVAAIAEVASPEPPQVVMIDDDEDLGEEEEGLETPDFEGLEDFDDEDFDDEFDDDFEEELEDEYDFDEFDEHVTEEDLEEAENELPLAGDFVDEEEEEEKVVEELPEEKEPGEKGKKPPKTKGKAPGKDRRQRDE